MLYFFVSAASAWLCWRAIDNESAAGAEASLEDGEGGDSASENIHVDGRPAMATTAGEGKTATGPGSPVPLALKRLQLVVWNIACVVSLIVVALFWFADVSTVGELKTVSAKICHYFGVIVHERVL